MSRQLVMLWVAIGWLACGWSQEAFRLRSPAFSDGAAIPPKYTCDGRNVSPPLTWTGLPANARYIVLIVDDPDAPTQEPFVHWVAYHIPAEWGGLEEGASRRRNPGFAEGRNDFGLQGWAGPCPPRKDGPHRYYFKAYAVKEMPALVPGLRKKDILRAIGPYTVGRATLIGTYQRHR